jgi:transposase
MAAVMIGVDPHKASHTAVAISAAEEPLGELRVRACAVQAERLLAWAAAWPQRTWAIEGAGGLGHLLAQQLLAAGERVLDVPPKLGARVRLLATGDTNKNDPNDARSVAIAALRSAGVREVRSDDHAAVLKIWSKRYRDLGRTRTQVVCRLHAVLCELIPGGVSKAITAAAAARLLGSITPAGAVEAARCELAAAFLEDLRGIDGRIRETRKKLAVAVQAAGTSLTGLYGVGPVIAAAVIGDVRDVSRFPGRDHFAAYDGTAPIEVSSGPRKIYRLSRRGNRRLNHAIHMAAVTQIGHRHSEGRAYYDKKLAEGKTPKEALRSLKRQISNAIFACLQADARRAAARAKGPGGQQGNDSAACAAGSHPRHRLFGQATPGPGHHPTTAAGNPAPGPAGARGRAGHSSIAATPPPAQPQVQVERPKRSEDERPGGAARRRPHSAARKARGQGSPRKPQRPKGTSQAAKNTGGAP